MKKNLWHIVALALLFPALTNAQAIVKGTGIVYTNGAPTHSVAQNTDAETAIDSTTGYWYEYNRDGAGWILAGFRVQKFPFSIAPTAAPQDKQSEVLLNDVDSLYRWRSGSWRHLNKVVDGSITNEGLLGVGAGAANTSILLSNTSGATGVTIQASTGLSISETTSSNGGTIVLTNSAPDQTVSITGAGISVVTGTYPNFTITSTEVDGSVTNEAWTIDGDDAETEVISNQTVKFQGAGITATDYNATTNVLLITSTEVDGNVANEGLLGVGAGSGTSSVLLSNTSGATGVTINVGGINAISETTNANGGQITITATEVDGSISNELQVFASTSDATSHTVTLSNTGGSIKFVEGTNITLTTSGTGLDGIITIASTGGGGSDGNGFYSGNGGNGGDATVPSVTKSTLTNQLTFYRATDDVGGLVPFRLEVAAGNEPDFMSFVNGADSLLISKGDQEFQIEANKTLAIQSTELIYVIADSIVLQGVPNAFDNEATLLFTSPFGTIVKAEGLDPDIIRQNGATSGQVLEWNGTKWAPATDDTGAGSTDLTFTGAGTPYTLNSSTGTDVTIAQGAGITLSRAANELTIAAIDQSATNEAWTIDGDDADTEVISNQTVKFQGAGIAVTDYVPGTDVLLITATEVDGSVSNELQTIANSSNATSHTATLSNTGGSLQFIEGTGIGLTTGGTGLDGTLTVTNSSPDQTVSITGAGISVVTGTYPNFTITSTEVDGNVANEGLLGVGAGSGTSSVLLSNTSGATGVTINVGGINAISETTNANGGQITITATEVDGSVTNEAWTIDGDDAETEVISNQTVKFQGAGITATDYDAATNVLLITSTEVDGNVANEGLLGVGAGSGTSSVLLSNTSGATGVTVNAAGILAISETTNANGGQITLTATEVDGSISNELQTLASTSNATSHTVTLSNTGGSFQLVEGSGITLTTSGTGLDGIITIAATGGGSGDVLNNGNSFAASFIVGSNDNNTVSLEQNGTNVLTIGTDKNTTFENSVAATNTATDQQKIVINSTGTAANNFGSSVLYSGESSTTNAREMGRQSVTWQNATDANREGAFSWMLGDNGGVLEEVMRLNRVSNSQGTLLVGNVSPVEISATGITTGFGFVVGNSNSDLVMGNSTGNVRLERVIAATNVPAEFYIESRSSGTAATGFGTNLLLNGESSTTEDRNMAGMQAVWVDATDATRSSDIVFSAANGAVFAEKFRIKSTGIIQIQAVSGTPNMIIGRDGSGNVGQVSVGSGLNLAAGVLTATGGAGLSDGDYGDISVTGGGTVMTIDPLAVTNAKINDVNTSKITTGTAAANLAMTTTASSRISLKYDGGSTGIEIDDITPQARMISKNGTNGVTVDNTSVYIVSGVPFLEYNAGTLKTFDSDATNFIGIKTPATANLTANYTLTLPVDDGTANQVLQTDGTGILSWVANAAGGGVATDAIWDVKGDLAVGTGANTAIRLPVGSNGAQLYAESSTASGLRWGALPLTPAALTADQDNYNPADFAKSNIILLSGDNGSRAITSIVGTFNGDIKRLINKGTNIIYFPFEHPDGTAGNRFTGGHGDFILMPGKSVDIFYDTSINAWRFLGDDPSPDYGKRYSYNFVPGSITAADWGNVAFTVLNTGTTTNFATTAALPPGTQMGTGTNAAGVSVIGVPKTLTAVAFYGSAHIWAEGVFSIPTLSNATETFEYQCGLATSSINTGATQNNFCGIRYSHGVNGGKLQGFSRDNAGAELTVDLGTTVAANTVYVVRTEVDKSRTEVRFYVDGAFVGRANANIPSAVACSPRMGIFKTVGTTARTANCHRLSGGSIWN